MGCSYLVRVGPAYASSGWGWRSSSPRRGGDGDAAAPGHTHRLLVAGGLGIFALLVFRVGNRRAVHPDGLRLVLYGW